jgi:hypothetical protein
MRFEQPIDIDARQQRVWDVLGDLEAWPQRIERARRSGLVVCE